MVDQLLVLTMCHEMRLHSWGRNESPFLYQQEKKNSTPRYVDPGPNPDDTILHLLELLEIIASSPWT